MSVAPVPCDDPPSDTALPRGQQGPLSFEQETIWALRQWHASAPPCMAARATRIRGELDVERLRHSLHALLARHPALRARFVEAKADATPRQCVPDADLAQAGFTLRQHTLRAAQHGEQDLARHLEQFLARPWNTAREPALRAECIELGARDRVLVLAVHALAGDEASLGTVHRELAALYSAAPDARDAQAPDPGPLAQALRQQAGIDPARWQEHRAFWLDELADVQELQLPADHRQTLRPEMASAALSLPLPRGLVDALHALAARCGTTPTCAWLAAFQALLARVSASTDFAVGVRVQRDADRARPEGVGPWRTTLALRTPTQAHDSCFAELLRATDTGLQRALEHADYPLGRLLADLPLPSGGARHPLYQACLSVRESVDAPMLRLATLDCSEHELPGARSTAELLLDIELDAHGASAVWQYRSDRFARETVERLARQFEALVRCVVDAATTPLPRVDVLDAHQRHQLLERFALGDDAAGPFVPVAARIAGQARANPQAVALRWRGQELSYAQLDARASAWAAVLRAGGAAPETLVALCTPRCFGEVVALLAILKSGAAYVPLDPDSPEQRQRDILADAAPKLLLAHPALCAGLHRLAPQGTRVVEMPEDGAAPSLDASPAPDHASAPGELAYVLFTSGSTGRPKGVQTEHHGLSNHIEWGLREISASARDVFLQNISAVFDCSLFTFLAPLCCGARVVLADAEAQRDMGALHQLMVDEQVTTALFVPSVLRLWLDHAGPGRNGALRHMACAGEALDSALARRFLELCAPAGLSNFYGPTEASVVCTSLTVGPGHLRGSTVSIGRPTSAMRTYVLNAAMQPQPIGALGELHVGGVGVARGYLGMPELTAERFIANPLRPGERLYRTGDLVRWLPDGNLEFLGRRDHQVKLRGLRIELGEIEAALQSLPGVRGAVVLLRGEATRQELAGFVLAPGSDAGQLRRQLRELLPSYMVPGRLAVLDGFPCLASGKVDRKALAARDIPAASDEPGAPRAPRSALQANLLQIWQAVLGQTDIRPGDDFFALGGNSLQATQVVSQVRAVLGVNLELRSLFDKPTLDEFSEHVDARMHAGRHAVAPSPIPAIPRDCALPLSFSQRRMWLEHQLDPQGAAYNVCTVLRLRGALDRGALQQAMDALCARHEAFRTRVRVEHAEPVAVLDPVRPARLHRIDDDASFDAAEPRLAAVAAQPFDLESGPLHRFVLARTGEHEHVLVLAMHHIITDDWSNGIVLQELSSLYAAARRGDTLRLPRKGIDFVDYAAWQHGQVDEMSRHEQLAYWLQRLEGMVAPALPSDSGTSSRSSSRGDLVHIALHDAWIANVQRRSAQLDSTPFMVLLGAFQSLLARWCAQDDVAVGFPIANRTRVEAEGVVGSLVNTLVMRSQVDPTLSFRQFLHAQVRPAVLGAFAHQDLSYDDLLHHLRQRRGARQTPGVRVLFNLLNSPRPPLRFEGLDADYLDLNLGTSQFDLALGIDVVSQKGLDLSYSSELFTRPTAEHLGRLFLHGVRRALDDPDLPLHALWAAPDDDLRRLRDWNAATSTAAARQPANLPRLLGASRGRDAVALRDARGRSLRYPDLWDAVDRLTQLLRGRGAGPGALVGLGLPRGIDLVVAQLAVWQAGAAYVPLDPQYPAARLHDMIRDAGLRLLVTVSPLRETWRDCDVPRLELDTAEPPRDGTPETAHEAPPAAADDPAYVIYTSGSTGKPKGVVVPHRAVVNFLLSMLREPGIGADDVLLAVTTPSFDISVLELMGPLCAGARVAIASHDEAQDATALLRLLRAEGATMLQATPATWRMLVDAGWSGGAGFKALVGGEPLPRDLADALLQRCGEVWNLYGPTETTVWSSCWRVQAAPAPIRIGRPIANTQVHVLDPWGQRCPIGMPGELVIGGVGVATGYLHRPELSAERFVEDPDAAPARMYRTGDRGRWTHDGTLEHLGRLDAQVKLRGFRIEPGEIESHLREHPAVAQSLAMVREDTPGDQRLIAYVVARSAPADTASLLDWLRTRLPRHMVPQHIVHLEQLPRLPNGKIHRAALPKPSDHASPLARTAADAPSTAAEQALAAVWAEVLGVADVRRSDNFFDLGGHSLLAQSVVARFARATGLRLSLRRMVHESLAQLAADAQPEADPRQRAPARQQPGLWTALRSRLKR